MNVGFKIIREMTKEEMIAELLQAQREHLERLSENELKQYIISVRTHQVQHRLMEEADLDQPRGILGMFGMGDSDE